MAERIAVVTGSSSGIGLLTCVELARAGFRVVATMRDLGRRTRLEEAAAAAGVSARLDLRRLDVCETASLAPFVADIVRDHGRIDVLVNNAGFAMAGFAEEVTLQELRDQFETNFFAHVALSQAVLPVMRGQGSGHVIMLSSISGLVAQPGISSYSASKFALEGWAEALRIECHALGIKVVLVEPGAFASDIWTRNVRVGEKMQAPDSPNRDRTQRYVAFVNKHIPTRSAQPVAELIARAATDPSPRLRASIGADAHFQYWFRRFAPWRLYEKLVAKAVGMS